MEVIPFCFKLCVIKKRFPASNWISLSHSCFLTPFRLLTNQLPPLSPVPLWPDTVSAGSQNSIRIKRILDRLVEASQRPTSPIIRPSHLIRKQQMGSVFSKPLFRSFVNHLPHQLSCSPLLFFRGTIIHDISYVMHLSSSHTESRKDIEVILGMQARYDILDHSRISSSSRHDGTKEQMCSVRFPIQPVEFTKHRNSGADLDARMNVMVWRQF